MQIARKDDEAEREKLVQEFVAAVGKEIEPLLANAKPFFGGSEKITLAEALTAPFIIRIYAFAKAGVLPASTTKGLDQLPNFSKWAKEVVKHPSVTYIWDEEAIVEGTRKRFAKLKAEGK